jgi:hypothetical protein
MSGGTVGDGGHGILADPEAGLLESAVEAMGGALREWSVDQIDHHPRRGTTAAYRTRVEWPDGERTEILGARSQSGPADASIVDARVLRLSDGDREVQVWRFPADPLLPSLGAVCDRDAVDALLRSVGVAPAGVRVRIVGYRPCRRAVIELATPLTRLYVKVLRPGQAVGLHRRLVLTRAAGLPTPRSLGWSDGGVVVLEPLPGLNLRQALRRFGPRACSPSALSAILDRLPAELGELPRRSSWSESASHYAGVIAMIDPELAARAESLAVRIHAALDGGDRSEPVHGDFYEAQLLATGGQLTGLLDVDNAGPGNRVDDVACLLAHLSVLVVMAPAASDGIRNALADWTAWFDHEVDPRQLRIRAAGVALSLAPGPYRTQEPGWRVAVASRVGLAEQWFAAARTGSLPNFEKALIGVSGPPHLGRERWQKSGPEYALMKES